MNLIVTCLFISSCFIAVNCGEYFRIDGRVYLTSYPDKRNWYQAKRFCTYNGMYLVDVRTDAENTRIRSIINKTESDNKIVPANWWTSGTDLGSKQTFYWDTTGHPMLYWDWAPGQPDNGHDYEHCTHFWEARGHKWNDAKCDYEFYFICRDTFDVPVYKAKECLANIEHF